MRRTVPQQEPQLVDDGAARQAADAAASAAAAQAWARTQDLETLKAEFDQLKCDGQSAAARASPGLALEPFLSRLFTLFDLDPRAAFALQGEQIDGAFTFDTDDHLLEARC